MVDTLEPDHTWAAVPFDVVDLNNDLERLLVKLVVSFWASPLVRNLWRNEMETTQLLVNQVKNLHALALENGLTPSFEIQDVDECASLDDAAAKRRCLMALHRSVHELLYAPPRGGR